MELCGRADKCVSAKHVYLRSTIGIATISTDSRIWPASQPCGGSSRGHNVSRIAEKRFSGKISVWCLVFAQGSRGRASLKVYLLYNKDQKPGRSKRTH